MKLLITIYPDEDGVFIAECHSRLRKSGENGRGSGGKHPRCYQGMPRGSGPERPASDGHHA